MPTLKLRLTLATVTHSGQGPAWADRVAERLTPGPPTVWELMTGGFTTAVFRLEFKLVRLPGVMSGTLRMFVEPLNGPML